MCSKWDENEDIQLFREYLQINTAQPNVNYAPCVQFLQNQANKLQLPFNVYYPGHPEKPVVIITWTGTEPNLPTILLNSHMDVVPVEEEFWTHPPFAAEIDEEGRIFARGTQDMKNVGMQYLAAIKYLKMEGVKLKRTVHLSFVPDEEIGGTLGMEAFVATNDFKALNVGSSLDEAGGSPTETYLLFYAEKSACRVKFKISGTAGHGSLVSKNTAYEKLYKIMGKYLEFRSKEFEKVQNNIFLSGNITSLNLTVLHGGEALNVVPPSVEAFFDIRVAIDMSYDELDEELNSWAAAAGDGITIEYLTKEPKRQVTLLDDSNIYWVALRDALTKDLNLKLNPLVCPGCTDARFLRDLGISCFGFSTINNTPVLLHGNDEFIGAQMYLDGIEIYKTIIQRLGNV